MQREDIQAEIKRLKAIKREQLLADGDDLLELAQRVVFSDITDIANFKGNTVKLKSDQEVDGQLIKKIGAGRHGPMVELKDEKPYLELLVRITGLDQENPNAHMKDDGFIEALQQEVADVWADEEPPSD